MNILITGGTGFLGKALTSYIIRENTEDYVVVFGRNEKKLSEAKIDDRVYTVCGDVRSYHSLYFAIKDYRIDIVVHAAALKRIDICQDNPIEAYKTNVEGTWNVIRACKELGVELCFISTDKACEPCTTYGATKYLSEQLVRRESQRSLGTDFMGYVIRYGNVLDSTGSVLEIWGDQYKKNKKVIVRDKEMTRFFWRVEESVKYISDIIRKEKKKTPGKVFIPHLKAMNIYDMASLLYGEDNIEISSTNHTEKIHESLTGDYCSKDHVVHPSNFFR